MITLGIAGGMGVGKSHVCRLLSSSHNVPIFYCDTEVKAILNGGGGTRLKHQLMNEFGYDCYDNNGLWNVPYIAMMALEDKTLLDRISKVVQPYLIKELEVFKASHKDKPFVAVESALFPKSQDLRSQVNIMVEIYAPLEVRIKRIKERDHNRSEEDIIVLLYNQIGMKIMPDWIIENWDVNRHPTVETQINDTLKTLSERV